MPQNIDTLCYIQAEDYSTCINNPRKKQKHFDFQPPLSERNNKFENFSSVHAAKFHEFSTQVSHDFCYRLAMKCPATLVSNSILSKTRWDRLFHFLSSLFLFFSVFARNENLQAPTNYVHSALCVCIHVQQNRMGERTEAIVSQYAPCAS